MSDLDGVKGALLEAATRLDAQILENEYEPSMTRAQGDQIIGLLAEILDGIRLMTTAPAEPLTCPHPEEAIQDLSSMGEKEWRCQACGQHEKNGEVITRGQI